ncbi:MAG: hypothetical protein LBU81_06500 [Methanosarcinales archaeon]|jgi:hypothetical protein|nr:hypothetical protein [Methanosarcinales archaeon]
MQSKTNSGCVTHPKRKTKIIFTGTVEGLREENERQSSSKYSITMLRIGDIVTYDRAKNEGSAQYIVEEIFEHGKDSEQRIVVAQKLIPRAKNENERYIFNARFFGTIIDLYYNQKIHVRNIEQVVSTRQKVNARGGYN